MRQLTTRVNGLKRIAKTATFKTRLMIANGAVMSKVVYLISVWGGAQEYLLNILQVQQLTAVRTVCGFHSRFWSKTKLLTKVGWLSIRQLIFFHTVLQAHKTILTGRPASLHQELTSEYPYRTRNATSGKIRLGENFQSKSSFENRAAKSYNQVPTEIFSGSLPTVNFKFKTWEMQNVSIDKG